MLRKTQQGWIFKDEYLLENFVWDILEDALDLIPLKRQFNVQGEYCDILARTKNNQLVVLELKNCEDRYIIHQLTRYYHSLRLEQPFKDLVDYSQPIHLIAIAPDFHKHNFIDRRYNLLQIEFIKFNIFKDTNSFYLRLHFERHKEITVQKPIPLIEIQDRQEAPLPEKSVTLPPRALVNFLDKLSPQTKMEVLRLREKMLGYDQRIKEIKESKSIFYSRGKTKPCCQLKLISHTQPKEISYLQFYLWLPIPKSLLRFKRQMGIGRMYFHCAADDFCTVKTITYWVQTSRLANALPMSIKSYLEQVGLTQDHQSIDKLVDLALKLNLERN